MTRRLGRSVSIVLAVAIAPAGCGPLAGASPASTPAPEPSPTAATSAPTAADLAPWAHEALTDVRTDETFRLADLAGRIILVEGMATWCPPCLEQQREAAAALAQLDPDKVVYVSVDVDPQEPAGTLADYADRHQFPWRFVVASPAFLRLLAADFGLSVLNPPATPVVIVSPAGDGTLTPAGIKSAAQLVALARQLGG